MRAVLVLEDGKVFHGSGFGAKATKIGELVFNTSMTGYQEALTDPSCAGQILLMTYPLIGNYGINAIDYESNRIHSSGFVVRQMSPDHEHRNSEKSLDLFLKDHGIPGIYGLDTRSIVRNIRDHGVMPAAISTGDADPKDLLRKIHEFDYSGQDYVKAVTTVKPQKFGKGKKIALIDYGAKMGIVRDLVAHGCEVHFIPATTAAKEIKALEPDGIVLSNGPGNPAVPEYAYDTIREISGYRPIFGICLGHQLLAHVHGGTTKKLKFGHRGGNHAVMDLIKNKIAITTQNHSYVVDNVPKGFEVTHIHVNDKTIEGMRNDNLQIFSVQYHPEASPGSHDSKYLFDEFMKMIK
ncbi:glutamine-hydrolyzing carbamoyl-phosphate synthase small subunit [Candidatus Micrarchaeota archaeon]|nr:glutamine-hydrolyzing carbamoyl-phosphate synthase small subunit [Candidatus Micrarchaeota archaeon]